MDLNLNRPIAFFDLETTGLNISKDRIVEIAILRIEPDHSESSYLKRINPEMEISPESIEIHGITLEDVKDCPSFIDVAQEIKDFIGDADLAGYNSNKFDIPFLIEQFLAHGIDFDMKDRRYIDVQTIFHKMEQRTLSAAYKFYCQQDLNNAHSAEADVKATYDILKAQLDRYEEVENDVDFLQDFTLTGKNKKIDFVGRLALNENKEIIYNFGKHMGKTLREVFDQEPGYHRWIIDNDFPLYTKKIVKEETDKFISEARVKRDEKKAKSNNELSDKLDLLKNKFNQNPK
ncbi:MAG: 3'-5' exonuclease [Crocinitomicaceae bacterium]|nr:3'-5' exonuclease [Crocinitomicaceae bacterium]